MYSGEVICISGRLSLFWSLSQGNQAPRINPEVDSEALWPFSVVFCGVIFKRFRAKKNEDLLRHTEIKIRCQKLQKTRMSITPDLYAYKESSCSLLHPQVEHHLVRKSLVWPAELQCNLAENRRFWRSLLSPI